MTNRTATPRVILDGIRFSATDAEVILHRLEVPDALAEALTDVAEGEAAPAYSAEDVLEAATTLERVFRGELLLARRLTPVEADTLADTIEGSTWASETFWQSERVIFSAAVSVMGAGCK